MSWNITISPLTFHELNWKVIANGRLVDTAVTFVLAEKLHTMLPCGAIVGSIINAELVVTDANEQPEPDDDTKFTKPLLFTSTLTLPFVYDQFNDGFNS